MTLLLQDLFEETKNHKISKFDKESIARSCIYIKNLDLLPELTCPDPNSKTHKEDIEHLIKCYNDPCLSDEFLNLSNDSVKKIFKKYCKVNGLYPDWSLLKDYDKDLGTVIAKLKHKHDRSRPKTFLGNEYEEIIDIESPSFPSGHTAAGYFFADMLGYLYPDHSQELRKLADLVGQSRIEIGVHFPSDVVWGKLVGEIIANLCIRDSNSIDNISNYNIKHKHVKNLVEELRKNKDIKNTCHNLTEFICRSNQIENYIVDYDVCFDACKKFLEGHRLNDCSDNHRVQSHLNALVAANHFKPIDNPYKIIEIHKQFDDRCIERGKPGQLRNYNSFSKPGGNDYAKPASIFKLLDKLDSIKNPYVKHIVYEWIHPFCDGNGRSGRVMLLADNQYDFENTLKFCNNNYFDRISQFINKHKEVHNIFSL